MTWPAALLARSSELQLADPAAHSVFLALLASSGAVLGAIVALLLCAPRARRARFRDLPAAPWPVGIGAGLLVLAAFVGIGWSEVGGLWSAVRIDDDRIELVYHFPTRSHSLGRADVAAVHEKANLGKQAAWQVVLIASDGRRFESTTMHGDLCGRLAGALREWSTPAQPR